MSRVYDLRERDTWSDMTTADARTYEVVSADPEAWVDAPVSDPQPAGGDAVPAEEWDEADGMCPNCQTSAGENWFDRGVCPEPCGYMHTRCVACGHPYEGCVLMAEVGAAP